MFEVSAFIISQLESALTDKKAENFTVISVKGLTSICDNMIIANGNSTQHVRALAGQVIETAKQLKIEILGIEGTDNHEWVLIDLGNLLIHIMLPSTRAYYELEKLWQ